MRFGVCSEGLGYPTWTHPPTPEITHGTTRVSISVPLGSSCWSYQNDQFPLSCPKRGSHLFLCYSSTVPLLRGASWPLGLFQHHKTVQQPPPPYKWGRRFQLHLLRWILSTSSQGQCFADYRTAISKKRQPAFCGHLVPFAHWELPKYHWLLSATFHVKRNFSHSTKISIPSKRHFLVNLTKKRGRFVWPLPFWIQGLRCLQLTVLEDTATSKTPNTTSHQRPYTTLPWPPCL